MPTKLFEQLSGLHERQGRLCPVGQVLQALKLEEVEALELVLADTTIPATLIRSTLRDNGYPVGRDAVLRHRQKNCGCRSSL